MSGLPIYQGASASAAGAHRRGAVARNAPRAEPPASKPLPPGERRELVGGVIGDKYAIQGILGEGGMGVVYEAEHMAMGRIVAIKVLHPENAQKREAVTRLQHEAKVTGNLGHPNICEIYDMGRLEDDSPYVVMERLRGETLAQKIKRDGKVEPGPVVEIALQVLSALGAAHASGIIHRDLKPENVFLAEKPGGLVVTKLLDFGISKAMMLAPDDESLGLTQTGMVMGTPYYMAPEQARGDRALDHRVDIWAVGVMMYEGMTGRRPFLAKNYNALLVKILTVWHRSLAELDPTIPPALALVVDKALSKMPEDRYRSAAEMQDALKRFLPRTQPASFALASVRPIEVAPAKPPPTFGLPRLDLHEDTSDGVPWTAVQQYIPTAQRAAVSAALAAQKAGDGAAASQPASSPQSAAAPSSAPAASPQGIPAPRPTPVMPQGAPPGSDGSSTSRPGPAHRTPGTPGTLAAQGTQLRAASGGGAPSSARYPPPAALPPTPPATPPASPQSAPPRPAPVMPAAHYQPPPAGSQAPGQPPRAAARRAPPPDGAGQSSAAPRPGVAGPPRPQGAAAQPLAPASPVTPLPQSYQPQAQPPAYQAPQAQAAQPVYQTPQGQAPPPPAYQAPQGQAPPPPAYQAPQPPPPQPVSAPRPAGPASPGPPRATMPAQVSLAPVAGQPPSPQFAPRAGPAARVAHPARERAPDVAQERLPDIARERLPDVARERLPDVARPPVAEAPRQHAARPAQKVEDEPTISEEPSDESDDDSETLVLVRDRLTFPKKQG